MRPWFPAIRLTLARITALAVVRARPPSTAATVAPGPPAAPAQVPRAVPPGAQLATRSQYGPAYRQNLQIGALAMHDAGFRGETMQIAVFDAGFPGVDQISALQPLFQEQRLLASTRNFVDGGTSVYSRSEPRHQLPLGHGGQPAGLLHRHRAHGHVPPLHHGGRVFRAPH